MLDGGQETRFKYYMEQILIEDGGMEPETARPLIQGLWTQGFRNSTDEAMDWLKEKGDEGIVDDGQRNEIHRLIKKYSRWR